MTPTYPTERLIQILRTAADKIEELSGIDPGLLQRALAFADTVHRGRCRKYTDEPYTHHPQRVATILVEHGMSDEVVAAGYLHDTIEDCGVTWDELAGRFGERIANLVLEVTDVAGPSDGSRAVCSAINREHIRKAGPEGQSIKLADLIDNTRDIFKNDLAFTRVYFEEMAGLLQVLTKGDIRLWERATASRVDGILYLLDIEKREAA